uniref:Uncharacterized protein n=1 Tax=Trichuris muris TaxID=70415 RepID=A0A5S6QR16_TRIMR
MYYLNASSRSSSTSGRSHLPDGRLPDCRLPDSRLPDWSFARLVVCPTGRLPDWSFARLVVCPTGRLPDRSLARQSFARQSFVGQVHSLNYSVLCPGQFSQVFLLPDRSIPSAIRLPSLVSFVQQSFFATSPFARVVHFLWLGCSWKWQDIVYM